MDIEACGVDVHHRSAEQVQAVLVSNASVEAIEAATCLGPVADANQAFISEIEQLSSGEEFDGFVIELYIGLAEIEVVPHIGSGVFERKSQSMKIVKLHISGQPGGGSYLHAAANTLEVVTFALSRKETDRRLVLSARPELAIQGHPRR